MSIKFERIHKYANLICSANGLTCGSTPISTIRCPIKTCVFFYALLFCAEFNYKTLDAVWQRYVERAC